MIPTGCSSEGISKIDHPSPLTYKQSLEVHICIPLMLCLLEIFP